MFLLINYYILQAYPKQIDGDENASFYFQLLFPIVKRCEEQVQLSGVNWDLEVVSLIPNHTAQQQQE